MLKMSSLYESECDCERFAETMIAPGTMMLKEKNCVRFFCSLCNLEITKFSKKEKETHWLSTHFSSELSRFTTGLVCSFCLHKADTRADLLIHVGVKHDKVYNFLPVLPFQTKQSL